MNFSSFARESQRIDTACQPKHYREDLVGAALSDLAQAGIPRESLWIQTKFTPLSGQDMNQPLPYDPRASLPNQVAQSVASSLRNLRTEKIDSLLLHSPLPLPHLMLVWRSLESFVQSGKIGRIGISNIYDLGLLETLYEEAEIKPAVVQNRFYAETGYDVAIRGFCRRHSIEYQSFWTLTANPGLLSHPLLLGFAERLNCTPEQAMYAFVIHGLGITPLNGTTNSSHMKEDLAVLGWAGKVGADEWVELRQLIGEM